MKRAVAVGMAVLLIGAGVGLVALRSNAGPSAPTGDGRTVSNEPAPLHPVELPQLPPKEAPKAQGNEPQVAVQTKPPDLGETPAPQEPQTISTPPKDPKTETGKPRPIKRTGTLRLVAECWAEVFIDGDSFGKAPRPPIVLPAGKHTLELRANPKVIEQRKEVFIPPSETLSHTITCGT
jgi:serine/threonine-protein kinase